MPSGLSFINYFVSPSLQAQGAFYVLGVGLVTAVTTLTMELTLNYCCLSSSNLN